MTIPVSYPGVYIREFAPGAPIQGVGTSTAALLGPSGNGPLNEPTKVTSWDQFLFVFGDSPLNGFYLWYAVRGFFENGGKVCYVTRVSNARYDEAVLNDSSTGSQPTIRVWAREAGELTSPISVTVSDDPIVDSASLLGLTAGVSNVDGNTITVESSAALPDGAMTTTAEETAALFRPGDVVLIEESGVSSEEATVRRVEGANLRLMADVEGTFTAVATVRLADVGPTSESFRVWDGPGLSSGSVIQLESGTTAETALVKAVTVERISPDITTYRVELEQPLTNTWSLSGTADPVALQSFEFRLTVLQGGATVSDYRRLAMDAAHPRYYRGLINDDGDGIVFTEPVEPPNTTAAPDNRPVTASAQELTGGTNDDPVNLYASDYVDAMRRLESIDDVNMVAIPDRTDHAVQLAIMTHCQSLHDRFAILDSPRSAPLFGTDSVEVHRRGLDNDRGFAALYYPWLFVPPAAGEELVRVPPSGHVAGIFARTDQMRGVHKAPAGNGAMVNGALGVERTMSDTEHGELNLPSGINVIRVFGAGGRPVVWGTRTTASGVDSNWQYVNIRRLFLFLEESIAEGIRWAVFEPNNLQLWQKLKRTITDFLTRAWRDGALFGETAEKAFYVRIDEVLNPFSEQQLGRLHIEIGVRPSYPAEFIIVRIGIWSGGSEVSES